MSLMEGQKKQRKNVLINCLLPAHLVHDHLGLGNLELLFSCLLLHRLKVLHLREGQLARIHLAEATGPVQ